MIKDLLENKTFEEKSDIKGVEIAKIGSISRTNVKFSGADYDIEVLSMNPIKGGIEVLARAWNADGQVGFGKDGTIDIERFRIINPPIMVVDGTKKTVLIDGKSLEVDNFKEDAREALLSSLAHIIKTVTKFNSANIVPGKIGNTTTTVFADASDGRITGPTNATWATARNSTTGTVFNAIAGPFGHPEVNIEGGGYQVRRAFFAYDVSGISSGDTVSSTTFSVFVDSVNNDDDDGNDYLRVTESTQANGNALASEDFDNYNTTAFASDVDIGSIGTGAYLDFTLNAAGISLVQSKIGSTYAMFCIREGHDVADDAITGPANKYSNANLYNSEQAGTTNDPKLVVVHAAAAGGVARRRMLFGIGS